jgi:hypothetical protein
MTTFGVITKVSEDPESNYAVSELLIKPDADKCIVGSNLLVDCGFDAKLFAEAIRFRDSGETKIDLTKRQIVFCQTPVFKLGEIIIMDSNDRTIPDGRKPSKWDVEYEYFKDIESAIKRAKEVVGQP